MNDENEKEMACHILFEEELTQEEYEEEVREAMENGTIVPLSYPVTASAGTLAVMIQKLGGEVIITDAMLQEICDTYVLQVKPIPGKAALLFKVLSRPMAPNTNTH